MGRPLKHVQIRGVQLKFGLFECFCVQSRGLNDIMSLLIHTNTLMAEKAQGYTVHRQVQRDCFAKVKSLSHLNEKRDPQGPHVILYWIIKQKFIKQKMFAAGITLLHIIAPPPCLLTVPFTLCPEWQNEKAKSKALLLQSTTRFPLHLSGRALK